MIPRMDMPTSGGSSETDVAPSPDDYSPPEPDDGGSDPTPAPEPDTSTTFDPSTDTLGTTSGVAEQVDDGGVTVDDSSSDPSDSSPAGGAGMEEAVERFTGVADETLSDATPDELTDLGNAASDVTEADTESARSESMQRARDVLARITGSSQPDNQPADAGVLGGLSSGALAVGAGVLALGVAVVGGDT